jgi:hypothetical protein
VSYSVIIAEIRQAPQMKFLALLRLASACHAALAFLSFQ